MNVIDNFSCDYFWLSNFYESEFMVDGIIYPTVEHYFQSEKTTNNSLQWAIINAPNPSVAKRMGRQILLRPDWEEIKDKIMYQGVKAKFSQNEELKDKLLSTNKATLVEGNGWHDTYWGVCNGVGKNKLGKILMQVREEIKD